MKSCIVPILLLISTVEGSVSDRFFVSAPNVFPLGAKEKVLVQMGGDYLNKSVILYLMHENPEVLVSKKETTQCATEGDIKTVELMIDKEKWLTVTKQKSHSPPYVNLVAEIRSSKIKKITRVLVSNHRGYIFIQTDQPMYNPSQKVKYRVFTLDHMLRPTKELVHISVYNAAGSRIMGSLKAPNEGIYKSQFPIPIVSKMGTWKITAHYEGDEANAAVREFQVQKFVLPSFEVTIETEQRYILLNDDNLDFTIKAMYSYGEKVNGAYHSQFGVIKKGATRKENKVDYIKGLEMTGSVQNGTANLSIQLEKIYSKLEEQLNQTLSNLQKSGSQLYVKAFVTNIQSGEIQEGEVYLPIISQKYTIDLSRTRSYYIPGYPLDVVVVMRLPDGAPAVGVPMNITVQTPSLEHWQGTTNEEGMMSSVFNIPNTAKITVDVSAAGHQERKVIEQVSPSNSYLYISIMHKVYSVKDQFILTFNTANGPRQGYIYYMVLSRGVIVKTGSLQLGTSVKHSLQITAAMVPSFRLIGYFYSESGDIIADSVWVDVRDECEINAEVMIENLGQPKPGQPLKLQIDLHGQSAKVALLAVDKAFYALKADNKLTAKQVFSSMKSYDHGCTYSGGLNSSLVLMEAGLAFVSKSEQTWRTSFKCTSKTERGRRSLDIQQSMMTLKSEYKDPELQECCSNAFSLIPMRRTCEERAIRVGLVNSNQTCVEAFLKCCKEAEKLRQKKMQEEAQRGLGRTTTTAEIEEFFQENSDQYIRRFFPPSFEFVDFDVNNKISRTLYLPDSITTWEIQAVTLSAATGFCVVKPHEVKAFKTSFVSLRLPYSVKKYEQLSISPVIYNYGDSSLKLAVNMEQTEGLCSPASATRSSYVTIDVAPQSSQLVSFSAVPMVTGSIPIKIRLYDVESGLGMDAVEKPLNVLTEGLELRDEQTRVVELKGKQSEILRIDGTLPDETIPDSNSNIFVSIEEKGFGGSQARNLLSPDKVAKLIVLPTGCLEQTTNRLAPTVLALRYLDLSDQWFDLPPGTRDQALDNIEAGYMRVLGYKVKGSKAYGSFYSVQSSIWATAYILKVMSLVGERQAAAFGTQSENIDFAVENDIRQSVSYLVSIQQSDGSFIDPNPVLHRDIKKDQGAWLTAFITLALKRSLQFLTPERRTQVEASILKATVYLQSQLTELSHTYAMALTAYCLSACLPQEADRSPAWTKLKSVAIKDENHCYMWTENHSPENQKKADAITVETTAYALLTAAELQDYSWAKKIACWLTTQENYYGGYKSTQDTVVALEALSEYELKRTSPEANVIAKFTVPGRREMTTLELKNKKEKVEIDLKRLTGNMIEMEMTGTGSFKVKTVKAYHVMDREDDCSQLSISVKVEGKVQYTEKVIENYDYYEDVDAEVDKSTREKRSVTEQFDPLTRSRRDLDDNLESDNTITYTVCVSYNTSLSGMTIADITLLSGFKVKIEDLDKLKMPSEQYISHYELSLGRVLIYFNEFFEQQECISFDAVQFVKIGLLQPAPAVFYDYYEPNRRCTVFYSAPKRSKMVSKLCSEDVCQCAERPCHKMQDTFKSNKGKKISKAQRAEHACFFPRVDYAFIIQIQSVSVKSNFELYKANITDVLRFYGDLHVEENSLRVFAKRLQCKGEFELGKEYLIMGKDGSTKDSNGQMQYLLESNTWVEPRPLNNDCRKSANRIACNAFNDFIDEYKINGCTQ